MIKVVFAGRIIASSESNHQLKENHIVVE